MIALPTQPTAESPREPSKSNAHLKLATFALLAILLAACKPATSSGPSAPVTEGMNRGVSLMGQYQYDAAVKAFESVLQSAPELTEAQVNLAIARFNRNLKEQRDLDIGRELLDAVLRREPQNARALYFKGIILQHLGQTEDAIPLLEKVVQLCPDDGVAWYLLGLCKQRVGLQPQRELQRAIELRPYLGSAYYRLWQSLQAEGRTNEAAPYLEKFKELRENPLIETIELPQYNHMGDLALVYPLTNRQAPPIARAQYQPGTSRRLLASTNLLALSNQATTTAAGAAAFGGLAAGDVNGDNLPDFLLAQHSSGSVSHPLLLLSTRPGGVADATAASGLASVQAPSTAAFGDVDNDGQLDLLVGGSDGLHLFQGDSSSSRFTEITRQSGLGNQSGAIRTVLLLDADHDGDLDLLVATTSGNQLWNNNADGTFTNLTGTAGIACTDSATVAILPADLDGDRDLDLVLLQAGRPARVFLNELLGHYREVDKGLAARGDLGGALQDFTGDGLPDLVVLGGSPATPRLWRGDRRGGFHRDEPFAQCARAAGSFGPLHGLRALDLDLDGDLDIVVFSNTGHALLNDGEGGFALHSTLWPSSPEPGCLGAEVFDVTGDLVPDLLRLDPQSGLVLVQGSLTPPTTALAIVPSGIRSRDKRTRSPASGYGVSLTSRAGLREQRLLYFGTAGGPCQSHLPAVLGLGGARQADYLLLLWSDGVAQAETALAAGQTHRIAELQRKISSCPVLFAWNGSRFECITDFAGVGGLGYLAAPGEYATPRPLEHLKLEPHQLQARQGHYELRITEPMEESAYIDRLELVAIDHPTGVQVFPDERLAVSGPPPTHELFAVEQPIFAKHATTPEGRDCTENLRQVDRVYAYSPALDRRFFGFSHPHTLELDFADQLARVQTGQRVILFLNGYLEYPYSQTVYAASQAGVSWQPLRIDRQAPDGSWTNLLPDAGTFGGMARTMTVDLTGLVSGPSCKLRLTSNLEMYYDRAFLAHGAAPDRVRRQKVSLTQATLRRVGFAREYSPDGREPLLYDYEHSEATAPFHVLKGAYTRYGPVEELLADFDDRYVIMGPGDEIDLRFNASALVEPPAGHTRSFILVSHAWCKDMDLYTGTPQTVEPLPFRGMSRYPYPASESYPDAESHRHYRQTSNTRIVD